MKEIWVPTNADPSEEWTVRRSLALPSHVRVAEGPAKIIDGKVKLFACIDGHDEEASLGTNEIIAELSERTEADMELQKSIPD